MTFCTVYPTVSSVLFPSLSIYSWCPLGWGGFEASDRLRLLEFLREGVGDFQWIWKYSGLFIHSISTIYYCDTAMLPFHEQDKIGLCLRINTFLDISVLEDVGMQFSFPEMQRTSLNVVLEVESCLTPGQCLCSWKSLNSLNRSYILYKLFQWHEWSLWAFLATKLWRIHYAIATTVQ